MNIKTRVRAGQHTHVPGLLDLAERHGATVSVEAAYPVAEGNRRSELSAPLVALKRKRAALRTRGAVLARLDEALDGGVPGCLAARAFFNVDELGRVSRCPEIRPPTELLADLRSSVSPSDWLPALTGVHRGNTCRRCWSASRGEVEAVYSFRGMVSLLPDLLRP